MGGAIAGEGAAYGRDTRVDADVTLSHRDHGAASTIRGAATFTSVARSAEEEPPAAFTDIFAAIFGADFVRVTRTVREARARECDGDVVEARSTTVEIVAVDFDAFDFGAGPVARESVRVLPSRGTELGEGNLTTYDVDVSAADEETHVASDVTALSLEDQLSTASVYAEVLV